MDHAKCINDVLARYVDQPTVLSDITKIINYLESQSRMFIKSTLKSAPAPRSIANTLSKYPAQLRRDLLLAVDDFVDIATKAAVNGVRSLPDTDSGVSREELISVLVNKHFDTLRGLHGDTTPASLRDDLEFFATTIVDRVCGCVREAVDDLIKQAVVDAQV